MGNAFMDTTNELIASLALFRELYNNDNDLYDVIEELLKYAISQKSQWIFTSCEATVAINSTYAFSIPEAVISTTLRRKVKKSTYLSYNEGSYRVDKENLGDISQISEQQAKNKSDFEKIFSSLKTYIEKITEENIDNDTLMKNLHSFIIGNGVDEKYSELISRFIVAKKESAEYRNPLNAIREGFVIYTGVIHSNNFNDIGNWTNSLTIYLDTEHLFNAAGINGEIYGALFNDFYSLVREANTKSKKIVLKYFPEIKEEIENYFYVAQNIVEGNFRKTKIRTAMETIINGCSNKADVITKKHQFYRNLESKGIFAEKEIKIYDNYKLNIESSELLTALQDDPEFRTDESEIEKHADIIKQFNKVNCLRDGKSNVNFESCGYIILTANSLTRFLAFHSLIRESEKAIPYATDIEFLTNRLWFKLHKGFSDNSKTPLSFDYLTKAQITLSSLINRRVSDVFDELTEKIKTGEISKEAAVDIYSEFHTPKPEDINESDLDNLLFMSQLDIETAKNERSRMKAEIAEGNKAKQELEEYKKKEKLREAQAKYLKESAIRMNLKPKFKRISICLKCLPALFTLVTSFFLYQLILENDTPFTITTGFVTYWSFVFIFYKFTPFNNYVRNKIKRSYGKKLAIELASL